MNTDKKHPENMKKYAGLIAMFPIFLLLFTSSFTIFKKKSGIEGTVVKISGNQMPSPDRPPSAPVGIRATVCIYALTNMSQVVREGQSASYTSIKTKLIKTVESDSKGKFKVRLDPGKYSLFIKTEKGFYSNGFDGQNNINPVEVIKKKMSKVELRFDQGATY
jgi:hypothetical protein